MLKRGFDIVVAVSLALILAPILLLLYLAVRWNMGKPVFFRQLRPGQFGQPFELIKFRTMTNDKKNDISLADAVRLTGVGRFLRATSLDELPELWNVIRGEMSLVGPRPLLMEYLPLYSEEQKRRHEVRPGITGWAQINGRNNLSWEERFKMDVWYVDNRSFWLDLKILLLTVRKVLLREDVNQDGHATAEKFKGNKQ